MKRIIRWIADKCGVTDEIKIEAYKLAGKEMQMYAHCFTGGTFIDGHKYDMSNVLYEYPKWCLNRGWPHLYGGQSMDLRDKLWKLSEQNESIIVEENKKHTQKEELAFMEEQLNKPRPA